ncbi:MAG: hypothetical protein GY896_06330 [Gammaproteobacteria bacterium]|nr:hypothetical protein [Gammaproteobacteria bacterium]
MTPFVMGILDMIDITTEALSEGLWDFSFLDLDLVNTFNNDVDLEVWPTINYILGEWPAPGTSPLSIGLVDETFGLDFNTLQASNLFSIQVSAVPVAAAIWLFGSALVGFIGMSRRMSVA